MTVSKKLLFMKAQTSIHFKPLGTENVFEGIVGKIDFLSDVASAFARTSHKLIYIIDLCKRDFKYISETSLFFCGRKKKEIMTEGFFFYLKHVPKEDLDLLIEIRKAAFHFYNNTPLVDRTKYSISFDLHLRHKNGKIILLHHKLTPIMLDRNYNIHLALGVVTLSSAKSSGNILINKEGENKMFAFDSDIKRWINKNIIRITPQEREILAFSIQGFTMKEIADKMQITAATVKFHRKNILVKLKVRNIAEAISFVTNYKML